MSALVFNVVPTAVEVAMVGTALVSLAASNHAAFKPAEVNRSNLT